jgi:methyl-accepting chemotaxis protein
MAHRLTIRTKILAILCGVSIASAGITSYIGYSSAHEALEREAFNRLTAVREMKAAQVEDYFQQISDQIITFSEDRMIIDAVRALRSGFQDIAGELNLMQAQRDRFDDELHLYYENEFLARLNPNLERAGLLSRYWPADVETRVLQYHYIAANPHDTGSKLHLADAADGSRYSAAHRLYHPIIRDYLERFGYYDIFLVDPETGHIVYSVFKEVDFGTSLISGPYRETNFARAFGAARSASFGEFVRLVDFEPYHPSYNAPASFIASPIYDGSQLLGVLVFQMPVDRINDIMTSNEQWTQVGLGASGETYIVGDDYTLRNQSRFLIEDRDEYLRAIEEAGVPRATVAAIGNFNSTIGLQEVRTEGTEAAQRGETGTRVFTDYRGASVLSAYRPLDISDVDWVVMSEIDEAEAFRPAASLRNRALFWLGILIVLFVIVAVVFSQSLTRPLKALSRGAAELARGELEVQVDTRGQDEIGDLARSFDAMRQSLKELVDRQESAIEALSTPLIPLHDEVTVMPLVGDLDEQRVERIRESLVNGLHESGARVAILDVTGVPALEESVAVGLVRVAKAARLLGARVIITGMQPELAKSLVELDLQLDGIASERTLRHGIDTAMDYIRGSR